MMIIKYVCPECASISDTLNIRQEYRSSRTWTTTTEIDLKGKEGQEEDDFEYDDSDDEGNEEAKVFICIECDFESEKISDFIIDKKITKQKLAELFKKEEENNVEEITLSEYITLLKAYGFEVEE